MQLDCKLSGNYAVFDFKRLRGENRIVNAFTGHLINFNNVSAVRNQAIETAISVSDAVSDLDIRHRRLINPQNREWKRHPVFDNFAFLFSFQNTESSQNKEHNIERKDSDVERLRRKNESQSSDNETDSEEKSGDQGD